MNNNLFIIQYAIAGGILVVTSVIALLNLNSKVLCSKKAAVTTFIISIVCLGSYALTYYKQIENAQSTGQELSGIYGLIGIGLALLAIIVNSLLINNRIRKKK